MVRVASGERCVPLPLDEVDADSRAARRDAKASRREVEPTRRSIFVYCCGWWFVEMWRLTQVLGAVLEQSFC